MANLPAPILIGDEYLAAILIELRTLNAGMTELCTLLRPPAAPAADPAPDLIGLREPAQKPARKRRS